MATAVCSDVYYAILFLTKYIYWQYEEEIRIIDYNKNGTRKSKRVGDF